jgi:hypothetical protein
MLLRNSRRRFLVGFLKFGLLALAQPRLVWPAVAKRPKHDPLTLKLENLLAHKQSAAIIGRAYLQTTPDEWDPEILLDLIASRCGERIFDSEIEEVRDCLRRGIRTDFEEAHIVKIHGWLLSITEARLSALAALVFDRVHSS